MPLREFSRLTNRLLVHLGEEAILRGEVQADLVPPLPERRVNVEHGVEFADANNQAIFNRSLATINKVDMPAHGDSLELVGGGYFVLDTIVKDNGYSEQWIVRGEPKPP